MRKTSYSALVTHTYRFYLTQACFLLLLCQRCYLFLSPETQVVVLEAVEKSALDQYLSRHVVSVVGFFSSSANKEKEEFLHSWQQFAKVPAALINVDPQDPSLKGKAFQISLHKKYEQPQVVLFDLPLEKLEEWYWQNAPTIEPHNPVRVNQLSADRQYIVNLYLNFQNEKKAEFEYITLLPVAISFKKNFAFFYHDSEVHGSQLRSFALNTSESPHILTLEFKTNQLFILNESYTVEHLHSYFQSILDGKYSPFVRSARPATTSNNVPAITTPSGDGAESSVREITADSFTDEVLSNDDDVLLEIYQNWCDECLALKQMVSFLAHHAAASQKLRVLRLDVGNNDLPFWVRLTKIPSIFLFPADKKAQMKYETFQGDITFKKLVSFLEKFASNKLEYTEDIAQHPEVQLADLQPQLPLFFGLEDDDGPNPNQQQLIKDQFDDDDEIMQLMNFLFGGVSSDHDGHSHSHTVNPLEVLSDLLEQESEDERRLKEREKHKKWLQEDDRQFRRFLKTAYVKFQQHRHEGEDHLDQDGADDPDEEDEEDEYDEEEFHRLVMLMMGEMRRVQKENRKRKKIDNMLGDLLTPSPSPSPPPSEPQTKAQKRSGVPPPTRTKKSSRVKSSGRDNSEVGSDEVMVGRVRRPGIGNGRHQRVDYHDEL